MSTRFRWLALRLPRTLQEEVSTMKLIGSRLVALGTLLVICPFCIASITDLVKFRFGEWTTFDLEKSLGAGEPCIGGHSTSGRSWTLRDGTGFYSDGFERDTRGRTNIVDTLRVWDWPAYLGGAYKVGPFFGPQLQSLKVGDSMIDALQKVGKWSRDAEIVGSRLKFVAKTRTSRSSRVVTVSLRFGKEGLVEVQVIYDKIPIIYLDHRYTTGQQTAKEVVRRQT